MSAQDHPVSPRHDFAPRENPVRLTHIQLGDDLWFDQERYLILRSDATLPLTAREALLLTRLLETPHRFLSTTLLARVLTRPEGFPLDEHGVEQVVSSLRRKLGEPRRHPRLLLNRRGIGYGLFVGKTAP